MPVENNQFGRPLSVRAYNCLTANGVHSMDQLCKMVDARHHIGFRRCGRKTREELESLVDLYRSDSKEIKGMEASPVHIGEMPDMPSGMLLMFEEIFAHAVASLEVDKRTAFLSKYPDVNILLNAMLDEGEELLHVDPKYSLEANLTIWDSIYWIIQRINDAIGIKDTSELGDKIHRLYKLMRSMYTFRRCDIYFEFLSPAKRALLQHEYQTICTKLPHRVQNILNRLQCDSREILRYVLTGNMTLYNAAQCGNKSVNDIGMAFKHYPALVKRIYESSEEDVYFRHLKSEMAFLDDSECKFVRDFHSSHRRLPMFYLACSYFRQSMIREDKIFCVIHGIGCQQRSIREAAAMYNLSFERIRQLISKFAPGRQLQTLINYSDWTHYAFRQEDMICADEQWMEVAREEELLQYGFDMNAYAGICTLVGGFTGFKAHDRMLLVKDGLYELFNFRTAVEEVQKIYSLRKIDDRTLPIASLLENHWRSSNHACAHEIERCLVQSLLHLFPVTVDDDRNLHFAPNSVAVSQVLGEIIETYGAPMHISQIFAEFKRLYPQHRISTPAQLRSYLMNNREVAAIGRASTYTLARWGGNTLSIRGVVIKKLEESEGPIHFDELMEHLKTQGFTPSRKSLMSSLIADTKQRFVRFDGDNFGLSGREYQGYSRFVSRVNVRKSFDEHYKEYIDFIDTHKHAPVKTSDPEQATLHRWYTSVISRRIMVSKEDLQRLKSAVARRERFMMSGMELNFQTKCSEMMRFVDTYGKLPSTISNLSLYTWFKKNRKIYERYTDRRRKMFQDLLDVLKLIELC